MDRCFLRPRPQKKQILKMFRDVDTSNFSCWMVFFTVSILLGDATSTGKYWTRKAGFSGQGNTIKDRIGLCRFSFIIQTILGQNTWCIEVTNHIGSNTILLQLKKHYIVPNSCWKFPNQLIPSMEQNAYSAGKSCRVPPVFGQPHWFFPSKSISPSNLPCSHSHPIGNLELGGSSGSSHKS